MDMLKELILLATIFALCGLPAIFAVLVSPLAGALASGVLGYTLYLMLTTLFERIH